MSGGKQVDGVFGNLILLLRVWDIYIPMHVLYVCHLQADAEVELSGDLGFQPIDDNGGKVEQGGNVQTPAEGETG